MKLCIQDIRIDGGTQPRATLDHDTIEAYTNDLEAGASFPPVDVFFDGSEYWLADGYHRLKAHVRLDRQSIEVLIHQGTVEEARWFSFGVNQSHGLRRTNEDKARAVQAALRHERSAGLTDVQVAKHVGVSSHAVGNWRKKLEPIIEKFNDAPRTATRNGKTYQINTGKIGRKPAPKPAEPLPFVTPEWKEHQRLHVQDLLEKLPEQEQPKAVAAMTAIIEDPERTHPTTVIGLVGKLAQKEKSERSEIYALASSGDPNKISLAGTKTANLPPMPDQRLVAMVDVILKIRIAMRLRDRDDVTEALEALLESAEAIHKSLEGRKIA